MLFLKFLLLAGCFGFFACAAALVLYDIYLAYELGRLFGRGDQTEPAPEPTTPSATPATATRSIPPRPRRGVRWDMAAKLVMIGSFAGLIGISIVVVPESKAGVRVSQISGVEPGTLYAGTHFILPLIDHVQLYDVRDQIFSTAALEIRGQNLEVLTVEAREGLPVGLGVTVRYRIDSRKLAYIQANLPQPIESEIVAPVVLSTFRELAPNYIVRDIFSFQQEEFRERAAQLITARLAGDAIVVKEVLVRKIELPDDYSKGLEDLLMKEQEDDRTSVEAEIERKRVKIAESQAEAAKIRDVKRAEANAQSEVIMAKAQSDAMQYTLPLKQKQIEQSRLEAEARKEATIQNAEAEAQAEVIDSKAEQQRENLLAESEANRIRVTSQAKADQMQLEAAALKANPLLVQLTIAQRLSDKVQIMMVPNDGKFFFANDVLRSAMASDAGDPPAAQAASSTKP
jgi:regulator of protease activity HflC (stomatin/prohibitin superfamily)